MAQVVFSSLERGCLIAFCDCVIKVQHPITLFITREPLQLLCHVKNQLQEEELGLWWILSAPGDLHKFEVDSHDETSRRRITKFKKL